MERSTVLTVYLIMSVTSMALAEAAVLFQSEMVKSTSLNLLKTQAANKNSNSPWMNPHLENEVGEFYNPRDDSFWPCPQPADISPCVCTSSEDATILDMDCSAVTSDDDLVSAFSAAMPFTTYRKLTILGVKSDSFTTLDEFTFGSASFAKVVISDTSLQLVEDGTFAESAFHLTSLDLSNNAISAFPFESLDTMIVLTELNLESNYLTAVNNLRSESLGMITLSSNPGLNIGPNLITSLPNLTSLYIEDCDLPSFSSEMLLELPLIKEFSLANNKLTILAQESIYAPLSLWKLVDLSGNPIDTVEENFLSELQDDGKIEMSNAKIIELDETVWRPYFESLGDESINLEQNPLRCGCDIAWLFNEATNFYTKLTSGTTCYDGTLVHSLPPDAFTFHCT